MNLLTSVPAIITAFFLLVVLSYYLLFFIRDPKKKKEKSFKSVTVIIPAHNEGPYIEDAIKSVLQAHFKGKKEVIVIDDGSADDTYTIAKRFVSKGVRVITQQQRGKSASINRGISLAKGELIAIVDGDSIIHPDALAEVVKEVEQKNVAAATAIVKAKNRKRFIIMWVQIELLYNSLIRSLFSKINANVTTPGPLSVYRKDALIGIGGFSTKGYSEDIDVTIRLIRKGYSVRFAKRAYAETNMPSDSKGFFRQRIRFARGMINIFQRHLRLNTLAIDLYTLPLFVFTYAQAIIMGAISLYNIISGYWTYFAAKGTYMGLPVIRFFLDWLSIIGFAKWTFGVFTGATPLTVISIIGIVSTLLTYPLYLYAIFKYDKRIDIWHIVPLIFMFPFWLLIMAIYILNLPEMFRGKQYNIWKKNER